MQEIKIGVAGFGWWGQVLAETFRTFSDVQVVAVSKRRRNFPEEFLKDARYYSDTEEMFEKEQMDGVVVATPPDVHYPVVKMAAERGIDIFCEKPMAHTVSDCEKMIAVCRTHNVKLMIAFKHRFSKSFSYLREKSKDFGSPLWAMYIYPLWKVEDPGWKFQEKGVRGIIIENVVHAIDALIYLMGDIEGVYAEGNRVVFKHPILPDSTVFTMRFKNNAIAAIGGGCTSDRAISREYLDIHYEDGWAQIEGKLDYPFNLRMLARGDAEPELHIFEGSDGVHEEVGYFLECIRNNKQPEKCDGIEGKKSLLAAEAILKSIKTKQPITLK